MAQRSFLRPVLVVGIGLLLGWLVLATTVDRVFARRAPALALRWNPGSADANVRVADALLQGGDVGGSIGRVAALAERSIRRQPVNSGAARLLGIRAAFSNDARRAEGLARYAEAMSRRDLPTQLWLIETAVARNDIPTALRHYDRAMKTSSNGRAVLFPILAAAAEDRAIWEPLAGILARRPQWWRAFVDQMTPRSNSPDALYAIARHTGIAGTERADPALLQGIEKRLVELGAYAQAADLYNRAHRLPPGTGAPLRNGGFEQATGFDPFEWNLRDEPDLAAVRQPSPVENGGNALFLSAANGRGGDLAVQTVMLPPGGYRLRATVGGVGGDPLAYPHLIVRCARGGREFFNGRFPVAGDGGTVWRDGFTIPGDCPGQQVVLQASSSLDPSDMTPWIDNIVIGSQGER